MLCCDSLEWLTTDLRRGQEPLFVKFSKWNVMSTFNGKLWYGKNVGAVVFGCVSWKLTNCNQRSGYSVCFWVQVAKFANILNTFSLNHFLYSYQMNGNSVLKCDARPTIKVPLIPDQFHTTDLHICKVDSGVKPPRLNGSNIDKPLWLEIEVRTNLKKKKKTLHTTSAKMLRLVYDVRGLSSLYFPADSPEEVRLRPTLPALDLECCLMLWANFTEHRRWNSPPVTDTLTKPSLTSSSSSGAFTVSPTHTTFSDFCFFKERV